MCVLDALIFNVDRHLGNFGILIDNDTFKPLRMAPVFDHNQSLFPSVDDDHIGNLTWYASRSSPRFGTDLNVTAHALLTDSIRSDLKNLHGFEFAQHPQLKAPDQRLHYLSELVNKQIDNILERTTVLLNPVFSILIGMRKGSLDTVKITRTRSPKALKLKLKNKYSIPEKE